MSKTGRNVLIAVLVGVVVVAGIAIALTRSDSEDSTATSSFDRLLKDTGNQIAPAGAEPADSFTTKPCEDDSNVGRSVRTFTFAGEAKDIVAKTEAELTKAGWSSDGTAETLPEPSQALAQSHLTKQIAGQAAYAQVLVTDHDKSTLEIQLTAEPATDC